MYIETNQLIEKIEDRIEKLKNQDQNVEVYKLLNQIKIIHLVECLMLDYFPKLKERYR